MINFKDITKAAENLFIEEVGGSYWIERNAVRPVDPIYVQRDGKKAWLGIYRNSLSYEAHTTGATPWLVEVRFVVEIQTASLISADDCEDKLCDAEKEIIDVLEADRKSGKLSGTVHNIVGYDIAYELNEDEKTYYQAALITVIAQVRA